MQETALAAEVHCTEPGTVQSLNGKATHTHPSTKRTQIWLRNQLRELDSVNPQSGFQSTVFRGPKRLPSSRPVHSKTLLGRPLLQNVVWKTFTPKRCLEDLYSKTLPGRPLLQNVAWRPSLLQNSRLEDLCSDHIGIHVRGWSAVLKITAALLLSLARNTDRRATVGYSV